MRQIKPLIKKDLLEFSRLGCDAYPGMELFTEEQKKDLAERFKKRFDMKNRHFYGMFEKKEMIGGMVLYDFDMNLFGTRVLCGGGGFLAVDLTRKKEYVARDFCQFFLRYYRKLKAPVASLYPFRPDFYKDMGAAPGAKASVYRFPPTSLPYTKTKKKLVKLTVKDAAKMTRCFDEYAAKYNGMFYDPPGYMKLVINAAKKGQLLGYMNKGKLEGFLIYNFKKGPKESWLNYEIHISEMIYNTPEALEQFCNYLHTQKDQIAMIQYITFDPDFHHLLYDPRNDSGKIFDPVYHESNDQAVGIMYRVINNRLLFEKMKKRDFNGQSMRVKLNIEDTFLKENDGALVVYFENGLAKIKKEADPVEVEISMNILEFSALILGSASFRSLYNYKKLTVSNKKYVEQLERLFHCEKQPFCLTQF